jgi:DNA-binding Lrp family transcriptional regulator
MAKNSKKQILEDEKKILEQLSKNANKSINEIAKNCKFSRQKVWRIIKNLEKNSTIWGYTAIVDTEKQGLKSFMMLVKRTNLPATQELVERIIKRDFSKKLNKFGVKIFSSIYTNGAFDWIICFNAKDIKEAKKVVEDFNKIYGGFISEVQLLEYMFVIEKCGISNPNPEGVKGFLGDL